MTAPKKNRLPDEQVIEDLNIDPNDIDTHELKTVQAGGKTAEVIEENAAEKAQADEDKPEADKKQDGK